MQFSIPHLKVTENKIRLDESCQEVRQESENLMTVFSFTNIIYVFNTGTTTTKVFVKKWISPKLNYFINCKSTTKYVTNFSGILFKSEICLAAQGLK